MIKIWNKTDTTLVILTRTDRDGIVIDIEPENDAADFLKVQPQKGLRIETGLLLVDPPRLRKRKR